MDSPKTPPGLDINWTPAAVADAAALAELFNEIAAADDLPERLSPSSMEHELSSYYMPLGEKTIVGRDDSGAVVGYATAYTRVAAAKEMRAYVNIYVRPSWRDRGVEESMLDWAIAAGEAALRQIPAEKRFVCGWLYKKQDDAAARFADRGFAPVRHWWEMERPLSAAIVIPAASGFVVTPWTEEHDEPARLVYNAAFADHWGSTPLDQESWAKQVIASPNFRRSFSFVAIGDGQVVGYSACEEYPEDWEAAGQREAWIAGLGVLRQWRKKGMASVMLARSMSAMLDAGAEAAMIGVDAASPSGAQHLYRDVGFVTKTTGTTWQLEVD